MLLCKSMKKIGGNSKGTEITDSRKIRAKRRKNSIKHLLQSLKERVDAALDIFLLTA